MDNKHPKSEAPALKEAAAAAKDRHGLQQSIEKEKKHREQETRAPSTQKGPGG
jgi:hypothetical protein